MAPRCPEKTPRSGVEVDLGVRRWQYSQMTALVTADEKGRLLIRGTKRGRRYLVKQEEGGWWVAPAAETYAPKPRNRRIARSSRRRRRGARPPASAAYSSPRARTLASALAWSISSESVLGPAGRLSTARVGPSLETPKPAAPLSTT